MEHVGLVEGEGLGDVQDAVRSSGRSALRGRIAWPVPEGTYRPVEAAVSGGVVGVEREG